MKNIKINKVFLILIITLFCFIYNFKFNGIKGYCDITHTISQSDIDAINNQYVTDGIDLIVKLDSSVSDGLIISEKNTGTSANLCEVAKLPWKLNSDIKSKVTKISFSSNVSTLSMTDMSSMFLDCTKLKTVDISNFDVSNVLSLDYLFKNCDLLEDVTVNTSNFNTNKCTSMKGIFYNCPNVTQSSINNMITATNFSTANVTAMDAMFYQCKNLISVNLSNFDTSNVLTFGSMFEESGITSIEEEKINTTKAKQFNYMFQGCIGLTELDLSSWNTANAGEMIKMFSGCTNLDTLNLSGSFNTNSVANMSGMFANCSSLGDGTSSSDFDITFGEKFTTKNVKDMSNMFKGTKITKVSILTEYKTYLNTSTSTYEKNFNTSKVINVSGMFYNCTSLTDLSTLETFITSNVTNMSYMFANMTSADFTTLSSDVVTNATGLTDMSYMFYGLTQLTDFTMPNFDTSQVTNMEHLFDGCTGLTKVTFQDKFDTSQVKDMSHMFNNCCDLTKVVGLENFNTTQVQDMSYMFAMGYNTSKAKYSSLTSIPFGENFKTSNVENMSNMFKDCKMLTSLDVSKFDTSKVTDMSKMFCGLNLTSDKLVGLENLNTSSCTNFDSMFSWSSNLTSLTLNFYNSENASMKNMFEYCEGLKTLTLGSSDDTKSLKAKNITNMFLDCRKLETLTIRNFKTCEDLSNMFSVTNNDSVKTLIALKTITLENFDTSNVTNMDAMFKNLTTLTTLTLGDKFDTSNVKTMEHTFYNCSSLNSLDVSNFKSSGALTSLDATFYNCSSLSSLTFSDDFDTSNVTKFGWLFGNCSGLTTLTLGNEFDTSSATIMEAMFEGCSAITELTLNNFNTNAECELTNMFNGCSSLQTLTLGTVNDNKWFKGKFKSSVNMFNSCTELITVTLNRLQFESSKSLTDMFKTNTKISTLTLNAVDAGTSSNLNSMLYNLRNCLKKLTVKNIDSDIYDSTYNMFTNLEVVETITLENFDTSNIANMSHMFFQCFKLKNLSFGDKFYLDSVTNMDSMFYECHELETITLNKLSKNNDSNINMQSAFHTCKNLETLTLGSSDYNIKINNIKWMFCTSEKLKNLTLNNITFVESDKLTTLNGMFDTTINSIGISSIENLVLNGVTSEVENMNYMFGGCNKITNLTVKDFRVTKATDLSGLFNGGDGGLKNLNNFILDKFSAPLATNMSSMFSTLKNLETIDLGSDFDTSNVTNMSQMFSTCILVKEIKLPANFNTSKVENMSSMFDLCKALNDFDFLSQIDLKSVTNMNYMFQDCDEANNIVLNNLSEDNTVGTSMNQMFYRCTNLTNVTLGSETKKIKPTSASCMFNSCSKLENIILNSVETEPTIMNTMLKSDSALKTLTLKNINASSCDNLFSDLTALETLTLDNFNTSAVTSMECMFDNCTSLNNLNISNLDTSNVTNMKEMFRKCTSLSNLNLGNISTNNVTNYSGMFKECSSLVNLNLGNNFIFNDSGSINASDMFANCTNLEIIIGLDDNYEIFNGSGMFFNCPKLTNLKNKSGNILKLKTKDDGVSSISGMYDKCNEIKTLDLSNFTINGSTITCGDEDPSATLGIARECNNLTNIYLDENITSWGRNYSDISNPTPSEVASGLFYVTPLTPGTKITTNVYIPSDEDSDLITLVNNYDWEADNRTLNICYGTTHNSDQVVTRRKRKTNTKTSEDNTFKGYIEGSIDSAGNKVFIPEAYLTRAEIATMFTRIDSAFNKDSDYTSKTSKYSDCPSDQWYSNAIGFVTDSKIMQGNEDGTFNVKGNLTRAELFQVIFNYMKYDLSTLNDYDGNLSDIDNKWYTNIVKVLYNLGYADEDGTIFNGNEKVTRAETCKLFNKMLGIDVTQALKDNKFTDIQEDDWYYNDVINASMD